jgi:hypothetical protein
VNTLGVDGVVLIITLIGEKATMQKTKPGVIKTIPGTAMEVLVGKAIAVVALLYSEIIEILRIRLMVNL